MTHTYEYEPDTQVKRVKLRHHLPKGVTVATALDMRMYFPQELDALLHYNGFDILHKWGSHERAPFGPDSHQQVVICSRTAA
ncbi:MAG: hypothetical protein AAB385_12290 [Planctomycetota bacterium]